LLMASCLLPEMFFPPFSSGFRDPAFSPTILGYEMVLSAPDYDGY
jgi:hypothetical protein